MECNKEEALRAKKIAEKRMQSNDFSGALRIAQRAQHLFPDLENMLQLVAVCEVHCSAQHKVFGTEFDWYAILQVEKSVDEITLKKQFRKLALLLHPDKNNLPGAEAAFKFIGEAKRVLSDREARSLYDKKCSNSLVLQTSHSHKPQARQPTQRSGARNHNGTRNKEGRIPDVQSKGHVTNGYQQGHLEMFWTCCPCLVRNQCPKHFLGKALCCQSCGTTFIVQELSTQEFGLHSQHGQTPTEFSKPDAHYNGANSSGMKFEDGFHRTRDVKGTEGASQKGSDIGQNIPETDGAYPFGKSSQQKQHVFAKKSNAEDGFVKPAKIARTDAAVTVNKGCESPLWESDPERDKEGELVRCPDPEFSDFDKLRNDIAADQVWACYDKDGMPRYYARIKKVLSPGFKLQFIWLESVTEGKAEVDWAHKKLPVACGYYKTGKTEETEDPRMFSHQIKCDKLPHKSRERLVYYTVYPRKGEIWAIFKNWDIEWRSDPQKHVPYRYEFVEVLSDFEEDSGVKVACLHKVRGFVSLYQQADTGIDGKDVNAFYRIPPNEKYRFSHRVPSFRMTGKERSDVPPGSLELDPAGLDFEELQDSLVKERAEMRFHSTELAGKFGNGMSNSGNISEGKKRKIVMGLSSQVLGPKLNPQPVRTWLDPFLAKEAGEVNKEHDSCSTVGGGSYNFSKPNTTSSCFPDPNIVPKQDPAKSEKGSNKLRRSLRLRSRS